MDLSLSVGNMQIRHSFAVVPNFTFPVLLGSKFPCSVNAVINYLNGTVTFWGKNLDHCATLFIVCVFAKEDGTSTFTDPNGSNGRICVITVSQSTPVLLDPLYYSAFLLQRWNLQCGPMSEFLFCRKANSKQ